jgi:sulfoquinovosyltransferase
MPSETETLGFVVLEAMASGLPVVAVAAGGLTDVVSRPGENGLLYPPGNYATCAAHARRLIADVAARRAMGAAARREAQRFGWAAATRHLREQQYARAVCNAKPRPRRCSKFCDATLRALSRAPAGLLVALSSLLVLLAALGYALPYRPAAA